MTIAVDMGRKATKQTNKQGSTQEDRKDVLTCLKIVDWDVNQHNNPFLD